MFWALQQDSISLRVRVGVKTVVYVGIGTFVFLCVWSFFLAKNRQKKYFVGRVNHYSIGINSRKKHVLQQDSSRKHYVVLAVNYYKKYFCNYKINYARLRSSWTRHMQVHVI